MRTMINSFSMAYEVSGRGRPVLLVHGFPLNRRMWGPQINALSKAGYRIITPDLRGFGESEAPAGIYSIRTYADDLVRLLDHLDVEKAVIGGMSMGGYVLLDLLERYPQRCCGACFIVTRSSADDEAGKARRLALAQELSKSGPQVVSEAFAKLLFAPETAQRMPQLVGEVYDWMINTSTSGLTGGLLAMRERKDYTPVLSTVRVPSLVIGAARDQAIPPENAGQLADKLRNCSICVIPGGGHLVNLEEPAAFNDCLLDFLGQF